MPKITFYPGEFRTKIREFNINIEDLALIQYYFRPKNKLLLIFGEINNVTYHRRGDDTICKLLLFPSIVLKFVDVKGTPFPTSIDNKFGTREYPTQDIKDYCFGNANDIASKILKTWPEYRFYAEYIKTLKKPYFPELKGNIT